MEATELVNALLKAVLIAAIPILVKFAADYLKTKLEEVARHIDDDNRYMIAEAVEIAVKAAEQSGLAGLIKNEAAEKKRHACLLAEKYLADFGIYLDLDVLANMIEAEVWQQFGRSKKDQMPIEAAADHWKEITSPS